MITINQALNACERIATYLENTSTEGKSGMVASSNYVLLLDIRDIQFFLKKLKEKMGLND